MHDIDTFETCTYVHVVTKHNLFRKLLYCGVKLNKNVHFFIKFSKILENHTFIASHFGIVNNLKTRCIYKKVHILDLHQDEVNCALKTFL